MRNALWIALASVALVVGFQSAHADEPARLPESAAPAVPVSIGAPIVETPIADAIIAQGGSSCGAEGCSSCGNGCCPTCGHKMASSECGCCNECGKRQRKVARFLDWLIYVPLDHGKTKCCGCQAAPPPAWAFFPCSGCSQCSTCAVAGEATMYYAKAPGTTTTNQVVQTAYPPQTPEKPANSQPARVSSFNPQGVKPKMPVLDPTQFRRPASNGN